jgi:hypothetical protein
VTGWFFVCVDNSKHKLLMPCDSAISMNLAVSGNHARGKGATEKFQWLLKTLA